MCYLRLVTLQVGIRELRRDLSRYLRRVKGGERLVVTERGRPLAVLSPWVADDDPLARLVSEGRIRRGGDGLLDVAPVAGPVSSEGSNALAEQRTERL